VCHGTQAQITNDATHAALGQIFRYTNVPTQTIGTNVCKGLGIGLALRAVLSASVVRARWRHHQRRKGREAYFRCAASVSVMGAQSNRFMNE